MSNTTKVIIALVVVAAVAGGAVLMTGGKDYNSNPSSGSPDYNYDNSNTNDENQPVAATITYTDDGFSPASVTVKSGESIRIVNNSSDAVAPSSGPHPTHDANPELNFPRVPAGQSAAQTLTTKGTWEYHNNLKEDHRATVVVE